MPYPDSRACPSQPVGTDVATADRPTFTVQVNDVCDLRPLPATVSMAVTDRIVVFRPSQSGCSATRPAEPRTAIVERKHSLIPVAIYARIDLRWRSTVVWSMRSTVGRTVLIIRSPTSRTPLSRSALSSRLVVPRALPPPLGPLTTDPPPFHHPLFRHS